MRRDISIPETIMDQEETINFLSDPKSYDARTDHVERHETHGAIVFLVKDRAYKLKRAVRYPYLDYSTPERRRAMCMAELAVNQIAAPELYLHVLSIIRDSQGQLWFGDTNDGRAVDWVVVMRRFEQSQLLEEMRKRGALTPPIIRKLAEKIAEFHSAAEPSITGRGAQAIGDVLAENTSILQSFAGRPFAPDVIDRYAIQSQAALRKVENLLDWRSRNGFVRHCHGDLHLNNICLIDDSPTLFDAIEFNEAFSTIDVLYDFAFLLMDLEHNGLRLFANQALNRYLECTRDDEGLAALPLFLSCRAGVRAHVLATSAEKTNRRKEAEDLREAAASLLNDAIAFLAASPTRLIAIGGFSGTGKSTLAREYAPEVGRAPGAIVVRSDVLRKQLLGKAETERLPQEAYSPDVTRRVYEALVARTSRILASGHSVIADAVFGSASERDLLMSSARMAGASFQGMWLTAPLNILEQRVSSRHRDASDATIEVLHRQIRDIEIPSDWTSIDVNAPMETCLTRIRAIPEASCQAAL